jgi:hypothetical protein
MILLRIGLLFFCLFWVSLPTPAQAQSRVRRNVEVEWEGIEDATEYEVQVVREGEDGKKPLRFKSKTPQWSATIKPGVYLMQVRSYDDRGVPGAWSPASQLLVKLPSVFPIAPESKKIIAAKEEENHTLNFQWEVVPGAAKYKFKAQTPDGHWAYEEETEKTNIKTNVPVGSIITWEVTPYDSKGEEGDRWKELETFEVHGPELKKPVVQTPMSKYLRNIQWTESPRAQKYKYDLTYYNKKTKKWELVESKEDHEGTVLPLDSSRPTGTYKLSVQALCERRKPSTIHSKKFVMKGGFRSPASLDSAILRDSITKPTNFYFIASYFTTQVQYQSNNYDANTRSSFDALGAVGRLGLGYQDPRAKWGIFGIADISAFIIGGESFKFASMEAHITRKFRVGSSGMLLTGAGLFSKELPLVTGTESTGFSGAGKVRNMGPHLGFTYWAPLSDRYGIQFNGRAYYTLLGSTPSGDLNPALSYQMGVLGSYRLNKAWMGYAGYAYRLDNASYSTNPSDPLSFARQGQENDVTFQGHFLNLIFEYSF